MIGWKNKLIALGLFIFSFVQVTATIAYADSQNEMEKNSSIGYSVQKISPENELNSSSSFYDLSVKPGEEFTIEAKLVNPSDEEITIESQFFTTSTNQNGEISYTSEVEKPDKSLKYKFSNIGEITASDIKTTISPNSDKIISATITVPKDVPDGVILGSWYFEKLGQAEKDKDDEGIVIKNKYSYAMAVKLTVNKEIEEPNLNLLNVTVGLNNYRKVINANIQNNKPAIVSNIEISAEVMKKGTFDVLYKNNAKNMIMAPNSNFPFPIFLSEQQMKAGDYTLKMTAITDDPKWESKTWEWTKDFTITSDKVKKINDGAINDPEKPILWWLYGLILLGILLVIVGLVWFFKKNQKNNNAKQTS